MVSLMYPHQTEMDLSISYALYFAARGHGVATTPMDLLPKDYQTTARVLLSGLGADELFGGYVRHATAFARRGYEGLVDELQLDVGRICDRNLGRDDRVMAYWSREVRFPYLDETLMGWAIESPVWQKCDFHNQNRDGSAVEAGKRVLRLLADDLGMHKVAREKKRAVSLQVRSVTQDYLRLTSSGIDSVRRSNRKDGEWQDQGHFVDLMIEHEKHKHLQAQRSSSDDTQILLSRVGSRVFLPRQ